MFWLFLPALAAAGFFSNHVDKYLDHAVDPCDNFYEHVCPKAFANVSNIQTEGQKHYFNLIAQFVSPTIEQFRSRVINDIKGFPNQPMEKEDLEALAQLTGATSDQCMQSNENITDLYFLLGMETYEAHYRLQSTPHYMMLKKKIMDIFLVLKNILNKEFSEAPWAKRYPLLLNSLNTVKLIHIDNYDFKLELAFADIKKRYNACLGIATNHTKALAESCINYAACPIKTAIVDEKRELRLFSIIKSYLGASLSYNAAYTGDNKLYLNLMLYTMEQNELAYMIGTLDFVMSHEMGHVFFNGAVAPSNSECFRKHMKNACNTYVNEKEECSMYDKNFECNPVVNGNYSRLIDDGADWVAMHTTLKALRSYFPETFSQKSTSDSTPKSIEILKQFFYANAIGWCTPNPTSGDRVHSPARIRVNGIASLFPEFTEAFQCKRGSKMAKAATCLPFAGVGAPSHKHFPNCPL